jgi:UDP-galactopyranose mutase
MNFDYLVVGCGMYGAVFARLVAEQGRRVLLVDKRDHIGGNCYTERVAGIDVHKYGAHIFHTSDKRVWRFVNRFAEFNSYRHHLKVHFRGRLFSFPINLMTLHQLWGVTTPAEAEERLAAVRQPCEKPRNLEEWILAEVGQEIYDTFIRGYTTKQWGRDPKDLPASIIRRLPIRHTYNDRYFDDSYEGIPIGGYTRLFENLIDHPSIHCVLGVDYFEHREQLEKETTKTVYSGKIDEFFGYCFGPLAYRSLRFEQQVREGDFQGCSVVNYTAADVPYTRILEHKHFALQTARQTVITYEYPDQYELHKTPYYPIRDEQNSRVYDQYRELAAASGVIFGGRLGTYTYFDMHQVVAQAMTAAAKELKESRRVSVQAA